MDQEDYERLIAEANKDQRKFKGYTPEARTVNGKHVVSLVPNTKGKRGVDWGQKQVTQDVNWDQAPLKKRSERERVESLAARLWKSVEERKPGEMELILQEMATESWKRGDPVTYEDVKRLAITQMKMAAEKAKNPK